ncbi:MAG TPA: CoA activase [Clostridiales bacterium]|nr:CoA activase [Clostridiales bacterium]
MNFIGIDIGSTAAKTVIFNGNKIIDYFTLPTGWNSKETSELIKNKIIDTGIILDKDNAKVIATGYGRISVAFADDVVTEIKCHGLGAGYLLNENCTVVDIGGQDTKVITYKNGMVTKFLMNDKCSAGTGKFIEIMANRMGLSLGEFLELAGHGTPLNISSMCTVFAESEVIGYIGAGADRKDIAAGVIDSVVTKVSQLVNRHGVEGKCVLTGGLSQCLYVAKELSKKIRYEVATNELGRYAGALGAAIIATKL